MFGQHIPREEFVVIILPHVLLERSIFKLSQCEQCFRRGIRPRWPIPRALVTACKPKPWTPALCRSGSILAVKSLRIKQLFPGHSMRYRRNPKQPRNIPNQLAYSRKLHHRSGVDKFLLLPNPGIGCRRDHLVEFVLRVPELAFNQPLQCLGLSRKLHLSGPITCNACHLRNRPRIAIHVAVQCRPISISADALLHRVPRVDLPEQPIRILVAGLPRRIVCLERWQKLSTQRSVPIGLRQPQHRRGNPEAVFPRIRIRRHPEPRIVLRNFFLCHPTRFANMEGSRIRQRAKEPIGRLRLRQPLSNYISSLGLNQMLPPRIPSEVVHLLKRLIRRVEPRNLLLHPAPRICPNRPGGLLLLLPKPLHIVPICLGLQDCRPTALPHHCSGREPRDEYSYQPPRTDPKSNSHRPLTQRQSLDRPSIPGIHYVLENNSSLLKPLPLRSRTAGSKARASSSASPAPRFRHAISFVQKSRSIS